MRTQELPTKSRMATANRNGLTLGQSSVEEDEKGLACHLGRMAVRRRERIGGYSSALLGHSTFVEEAVWRSRPRLEGIQQNFALGRSQKRANGEGK